MTGKKILAVDDEEDILELLRINLGKEGYQVICAATGEEAVKKVRAIVPDLIILDLMLPGINGLDVARKLKNDPKTADIPIIMLTAKGEEADIVIGLELGADDYITKPFSPRILLARVKTVLRRRTEKGLNYDKMIRIHDLEIHPGRMMVTAGENKIELTYTEFHILYALAKHPGWVLTRSQIVDAVRGEGYPVTDRSVDVQIVGIRKKLGQSGNHIVTVRGVGYKFREENDA